jgi:hypothetical protein
MMECTEHKPRNRTYFSIRLQKEEWTPIVLALAAYLMTMGIGSLIYPR